MISLDKNTFPKELTALKQWVCWRLEPDKKSGRDTKVPYSPSSRYRASASNPSTWGTLDESVDAKDKYLFNGIGFVFTEECGIIGIDIDHCLIDGQPNDVAMAILSKLPTTYIEISPSGTGLHIFLRGKLPPGGNRNSKYGVEMYSSSRYFTMTGVRWKDCADTIADDNGAIEWVHKTFIASAKRSNRGVSRSTTTVLTDDELLKLAHASKDGEAFGKLYAGEWQGKYKSQSEADFALCCKLAFWSGRSETQIDRLFRKSGLHREKWDSRHSADGTTYGEQTVNNACSNTTQVYTPPQQAKEPEIFEQHGCYYRRRGDKFYQITNFIILPIEMINSEDGAQITCDFVTEKGERFRLQLNSEDMSEQKTFRNVIGKKTFALTFLGSSGDLDALKIHIYDNLEWVKKRGVKTMGIYPRDSGRSLVFVDTNGAVGVGGRAVNNIVQLEEYRGIESNILSAPILDKTGLLLLSKHILTYNEPAKTVAILAWTAGCFIKPHLKKIGIKFPHLFLIGEPGSGKSNTLERIVCPMVGQSRIYAASQVTQFSMMKEANTSNIIPILLDEFKPSKMKSKLSNLHSLYNHFRDSYDWYKGISGKPDQSCTFYDLLAPIAVAGEESADEGAIRERSIELLFSKRDLKNNDYQAAFAWLSANENLVRSFGRSLLDTALRTSQKDVASWHSEGGNYFSDELPSRIRSNLCAMYAGICLVGRFCSVPSATFDSTFPFDHEECAKYLETAAREYLLDDSSYNKGIIESTFEVMSRMRLKQGEDYCFENNNQYLIITLRDVYDRYTKYRKDYDVKGESLDYGQFCKQLHKTVYYVNSNVKKRMGKESKWVWVLDFDKMSANCDVTGFIHDIAQDEDE